MVVDTGWLFRQPVAASNVGGNGFAMEVETPAYPKEALLALTGSLGSAFDVEELSARPAGVGEGEGPYLVRSADRCLTYFDELKSDYLYDETAKILPKAVAAKMICERLDIPLTRFANLVESGVVRKHKVYNLRFSKAMPELRVRCWGEPDVEALERALARDKAVQA